MDLLESITAPSTGIVGLEVHYPGIGLCCETDLITIGSSRAMHHAILHCKHCGRFRGWLSAAGVDHINTSIRIFGRPAEPLVLCTSNIKPEGEKTMTDYDNTNRGSIWKNEKKEKPSHPDFTGTLNVGGVEYAVSAWKRKEGASTRAPALSFSIKPKTGDPISTGRPRQNDMDGDVPFNAEHR